MTLPEQDVLRPTADELSAFELFAGDDRAALEWIAERMEIRSYESGSLLAKEGDPITEFFFVLEGEIHYGYASGSSAGFIRSKGQAGGILPFSRLKKTRGRSWTAKDTRIAAMSATHLRELVYRAPNLAQKLVSEMTDRTREMAQIDERANKLLALGKLSAGLAHELNNPAAAAARSSARLREMLNIRRSESIALRGEALPADAQARISHMSDAISECKNVGTKLDELELADREAALADWLDEAGLPGDLAGDLAAAGIGIDQIEPLASLVPNATVTHGLRILVADYQILCLANEIEDAAKRISDLVQSIKAYSYMDQAQMAEVDVEQGITVTLKMFLHLLKYGYTVKKDLDGHLPKLFANGGELNQIWTNLFDNAIHAMADSKEKTLTVRTAREPEGILVEIGDSGPGIPPEIQGRIFEPFFTTKPMGQGTGLGLDIVMRIIRNHGGAIHLKSRPGNTVFQVRLPLRNH